MNPLIAEILTIINKQGYEAYLVGGAVRDAILDKPNKDYDICTNMPLHKIKELYPKFAKKIMDTDFSWGTSARKYYMLYERM